MNKTLQAPSAVLSREEIVRYSRHILLPEMGVAGQRRLKESRVLVIGAGGLGSPVSMYLAAAGVGVLGIVDSDDVELSNLQRQLVHATSAVGRPKTESAAERLREINPETLIETYPLRLSSANALEVFEDFDVIVDGTDNFATRYLVNDACVLLGKPLVYGSVLRFEGQATVFGLDGPCYRCLYPEPPPPGSVPSCGEAGVLGVLPGLVGVVQATEALKLLLNLGDTLSGRLLLVDALRMRFRTMQISRDPACPACGTREITTLQDYEAWCGREHGNEALAEPVREMTPSELASRLAEGAPVELLDVREPWEWEIARIDGARLVPLGNFREASGDIDRSREIVVYCHHGQRSRDAAEWLAATGSGRIWNLAGGIDRWRREVDPDMPRY